MNTAQSSNDLRVLQGEKSMENKEVFHMSSTATSFTNHTLIDSDRSTTITIAGRDYALLLTTGQPKK